MCPFHRRSFRPQLKDETFRRQLKDVPPQLKDETFRPQLEDVSSPT